MLKMFAQYKLPEKIILDRDLMFMAAFWKTFLIKQKVYKAMLTVYYLQTNGQIKKLN